MTFRFDNAAHICCARVPPSGRIPTAAAAACAELSAAQLESFVTHGTRQTHSTPERREETYPRTYWPGDTDLDHLEFALKREGLHLQFLRLLLPLLPADGMAAYVQSKPTSAYARRIWFLYEEFTGKRLDVPDVAQGNYVDLLDPRDYYTGPVTRSPRHRVNMNLLGTLAFSPMVRRSKALRAAEGKQLEKRCRKVIEGIPPELYARALQFLYNERNQVLVRD